MSFKSYDILNGKQVIAYCRDRVSECKTQIQATLKKHGFVVSPNLVKMNAKGVAYAIQWIKSHHEIVVADEKQDEAWDKKHHIDDNQVLAYQMLDCTLPTLKRKAHWLDTARFFAENAKADYRVAYLELKNDVKRPVRYIYTQKGSPRDFDLTDWKYRTVNPEANHLTKYEAKAYMSQPVSKDIKKNGEHQNTTVSFNPGCMNHSRSARRVWFHGDDLNKRQVFFTIPKPLADRLGVKPADTMTSKVYGCMTSHHCYYETFDAHRDGDTFIEKPRNLDDVANVLARFIDQLKHPDTQTFSSAEMRRYTHIMFKNFKDHRINDLKETKKGVPDHFPYYQINLSRWFLDMSVTPTKKQLLGAFVELQGLVNKVRNKWFYNFKTDRMEDLAHFLDSFRYLHIGRKDLSWIYYDVWTALENWKQNSPFPDWFNVKRVGGLKDNVFDNNDETYTSKDFKHDLDVAYQDAEAKTESLEDFIYVHNSARDIHCSPNGKYQKRYYKALKLFKQYYAPGKLYQMKDKHSFEKSEAGTNPKPSDKYKKSKTTSDKKDKSTVNKNAQKSNQGSKGTKKSVEKQADKQDEAPHSKPSHFKQMSLI